MLGPADGAADSIWVGDEDVDGALSSAVGANDAIRMLGPADGDADSTLFGDDDADGSLLGKKE